MAAWSEQQISSIVKIFSSAVINLNACSDFLAIVGAHCCTVIYVHFKIVRGRKLVQNWSNIDECIPCQEVTIFSLFHFLIRYAPWDQALIQQPERLFMSHHENFHTTKSLARKAGDKFAFIKKASKKCQTNIFFLA